MWERNNDEFEDEIQDMQPNHDLIFGDCSRNPPSLVDPYVEEGGFPNIFRENNSRRLSDGKNKLVHIVSKIRNPIGRRLEEGDLEDSAEREAETLAMLRNTGLEPSIDVPLSSKTTLPTIISPERYKTTKKFPVLLDSSFFKLKPRNSDSDTSGNNTCDVSSSSTDSSFLKQSKTVSVSQEDEDSKKQNNDKMPNDTVTKKEPVDIIANMKRRQKTRMSRPVVYDDLDESTTCKEPPSSEQEPHTSSQLACTKKLYTPKELYMQKRAMHPST